LLEALLGDPDRQWTRTELAKACGQHAKARMDLHLGPLLLAGVLERQQGRYRVAAAQPIVATLQRLLVELGAPIEG
jgi:hypothetical protein